MRRHNLAFLVIGPILLFFPPVRGAEPNPEQRAVAEIEKVGGEVRRDEKKPGKPIVAVSFALGSNTNKGLEQLKAFPRLEEVYLVLCGDVTDRCVEHLRGLKGLRTLALFGCSRVTDKGVEHLRELKGLRTLDLSHTQVTDAGLKHLEGLAELRDLGLRGTRTSKEAAQRLLRALPKVRIDQGNRNTVQKRARKHFGIPDDKPLSKETIRSAILTGVPAGSSEKQIQSFLEKAGIGKDKFSSYDPLDENNAIICRITFDPESGDLVHTDYIIFFRIDKKKGLRDVEVRVRQTGP
jgi:hypothetical protein